MPRTKREGQHTGRDFRDRINRNQPEVDPAGAATGPDLRLSDRASRTFPVGDAQQSLVELAGGAAGELLLEVDGLRHFVAGQVLAGVRDELGGYVVWCGRPRCELD